MNIKKIYRKVKEDKQLWNYYNVERDALDILESGVCYEFIKEIIKALEKDSSQLYENIQRIFDKDPRRLSHIVSTFFLGFWFYQQSEFIRQEVDADISRLYFREDEVISRRFAYVWFMISLFHDLGYPAENKSERMPKEILKSNKVISAPSFYLKKYKDYYKYRKNKEHGIWAGLIFDDDLCEIRESMYNNKYSGLYWGEDLDRVYHNVAAIILAHNIWFIREDDEKAGCYREYNLDELILSSEKDGLGRYKEYKFRFKEYPLFSLFCIIDSIDPIKSTCLLSRVDIRLRRDKIIVKSNDPVYLEKVSKLNDWLVPTTMEGDTVTIYLNR